MRLSLTIGLPGAAPLDVAVDVDDDATVAELDAALAGAAGVAPSGLVLDGVRLDDGAAVADTALVDGCTVWFGGATGPGFTPPPTGWQLHVVGGPDSGLVAELPVGEHVLGRSAVHGFTDRSMSRRHARLTVTPEGATVADLGSANGTAVEGSRVDGEPAAVQPGQVVQLGDTLLRLVPARTSDAAVERGTPGSLTFVRAPRLLPSDREVVVTLPDPPVEREARRFPVVMVVAPLVIGVVMAAVLGSPIYLIFAVASPVMLVSNVVSERRHGAREDRKAQARYAEELADAQRRAERALAAETARRRDAHPDAASVALTATLPTKRLWERRRLDPDAMTLRVGTADLPAEVKVRVGRGSDAAQERTVRDVPAVVGLREAGVLGLAGPAAPLAGLLRWLVLQLTVHHPPRDLAITLLAPRAAQDWAWMRWLPQARPADTEGPVALIGNDPTTATARVAELVALVKARREASTTGLRVDPATFPAHVLVVDGVRALRTTPGLTQVLQDGPAVGVYALCADEQERFLPEACGATAVLTPEDSPADAAYLDLRRSGADPVLGVLADRVSPALAETAARALAPLRDVSAEEDDAVLPDSARLLDVLEMPDPDVDAVRARWQLAGRSTRIVVGAGLDGPFALDLRADGPHGLIAGTTGSGKSELLQTMIASLAVANRPDQLNFVLVDYKGGSAFKDCVRLPHTVGMVTDLDAHLVERALTSLGAELTLREHWLADAGVKDIEDYQALQAREPLRPSLPRLLLVIDEFASMARELPDFVTGLVSIAQRGRSLGLHLLLATQRPSGVVSPEIRANTNLRICLRVTDAADSADVLEAPDAARLPKSAPGRGFARLGTGVLVPFQAGRVGGRRPGVRPAVAPVPFVASTGWHQLGYAAPTKPTGRIEADVEVTDLSALVQTLRDAAAAEGVPAQRSPWLDALPEQVLRDALGAPSVVEGVVPPLPFGLQDLPAVQQQRTAVFDPATDGHLLVIGSARSGRSQLLRTLAASVAERTSSADVHLYGLDCGNGALLPLQDLPHCGAVVSRTQVERVVRLLARLTAEVERRQALLADGGFADVTEQRRAAAPGERLPHLLLLLDRWEGFTSSLGDVDGGRLTDVVLQLLREGASAGVSLVVTGDRSLASGRIASHTDNTLVLRLADRGDYALCGLNPRQLPDTVPPGRGFQAGTGLETQIALLSPDDSGQGQAAVLAEIAKAAHVRDALVPRSARPFRVDVLPSRLSFAQAWEMRPPGAGPLFALVGVGGDELAAAGPDLGASGPAFVVGGPGRAGKSSLLLVMARSLLRAGTPVVLGAPRPSPLRELAGEPGVLAVVTDPGEPADTWATALAAADGPVVLLLDDAEALRDCPAAELFRDVVKGAAGPGRSLVLGGNAESICTGLSGWQVEAKKSRQGVLLSPQSTSDGDLIGVRLPRSVVGQPVQPGRGVLHLGDSTLLSVAVPLP